MVASLSILTNIQLRSIQMSIRADQVTKGTELAQHKLAEVVMLVEAEGLTSDEMYERGDFDDLGQESDLDFDDGLENYRWEYWVSEIDLALAADLAGMAEMMGGEGFMGEGAEDSPMQSPEMAMVQQFLTPERITEEIGKFIREVRVRVYWVPPNSQVSASSGSKDAAERNNEVVLISHISSPTGAFDVPEEDGGS
jgi:hypothetical protein